MSLIKYNQIYFKKQGKSRFFNDDERLFIERIFKKDALTLFKKCPIRRQCIIFDRFRIA